MGADKDGEAASYVLYVLLINFLQNAFTGNYVCYHNFFENEYGKINLGILTTSFAQATKFQGLSLSNNETNILLADVKKAWISSPNDSQKSSHDQNTITTYLLKFKKLNRREIHFVHRSFTAGKSPISTVELLNTTFKKCISYVLRNLPESGDIDTFREARLSGALTSVL